MNILFINPNSPLGSIGGVERYTVLFPYRSSFDLALGQQSSFSILWVSLFRA